MSRERGRAHRAIANEKKMDELLGCLSVVELRAATDLARLRSAQGQRAAARQVLAPVYASFTEGFDAKDLKEAKAVLDELESSG